MDGLLAFINRLGLARVAAMAVIAVLMLGFFAFLIMRASAPSLAPLYSGLSLEDSSAIVTELQAQNIAYEVRGDGDTILVPRDQITSIRMSLAQDGLPTRGQVGYEIFDQQSTLGATSFVQNINNVRALEGELARTIGSLARIKSARVHLVLPERALFSREQKDPTASIVLSVRGELSAGEIRAIQHLAASAVEGLTPMRVSVVDDTGRLLASGAGNGADGILASEGEERTLSVENRLRGRVEDLLANIVGAGRARVQVSAELDMNQLSKTSETFDPNGQVVRSTQTRDLANSAKGGDSGQVSVANELPGASANSGSGSSTSEDSTTTEETTNYEISKVTQTELTQAGGIKRLSIAVVVDGTYVADANGNATYTPRTPAEIDQITALVKSAIGYDQARGDQVQVANLQFADRPDLAAQGTASPGLFDFTRDDLMNGAEMAVTLLIALALVFFVLRPLLKRVLAPENKTLALPASAELGAAPGVPAPGQFGADGVPSTLPNLNGEYGDDDQPIRPKGDPAWMKNAKSMGEAQANTLRTVGSLVEEHPKQAALIVRDWLGSAA
ncbi:MAG: flagellar M-ring protein FliF [Devosia sp.]|uniref:flagellar basal-body MS-ring/collar protein FliF n=1 Tax=Devosia sp. TaxID=1871048 RepID=UPI001ACF7D6A|nr:flagellar basal-body MS-ring/collar protein FliF [Devosia sp.]MBN9310871.1 flagellar M-ring protein FliF [Devosia sp.]MBN9315365.1 flagellar M-ring protein FliF [Devosia sp.]